MPPDITVKYLKATIRSLEETVKFHEARGEVGDYPRSRALFLLDRTRTRLVDATKRAKAARLAAAARARENA